MTKYEPRKFSFGQRRVTLLACLSGPPKLQGLSTVPQRVLLSIPETRSGTLKYFICMVWGDISIYVIRTHLPPFYYFFIPIIFKPQLVSHQKSPTSTQSHSETLLTMKSAIIHTLSALFAVCITSLPTPQPQLVALPLGRGGPLVVHLKHDDPQLVSTAK